MDSRLVLFLGIDQILRFPSSPTLVHKKANRVMGYTAPSRCETSETPKCDIFLNHVKLHHWAQLVVAVFWDFSRVSEVF